MKNIFAAEMFIVFQLNRKEIIQKNSLRKCRVFLIRQIFGKQKRSIEKLLEVKLSIFIGANYRSMNSDNFYFFCQNILSATVKSSEKNVSFQQRQLS